MTAAVKPKPAGALILVCCKCTRQGVFPSVTRDEANNQARVAGWRIVGDRAFCKKDAKRYLP